MKVTVLPCKRSQILFPMPQKILKEEKKEDSPDPETGNESPITTEKLIKKSLSSFRREPTPS